MIFVLIKVKTKYNINKKDIVINYNNFFELNI